MSKGQALIYATVAVVLAIICLPTQIYGCILPFIVIAMVFGGIAYAKHQRDQDIIAQAEQEQIQSSRHMPLPPPMTSKGSSRLFVPPPLQHK